MEAETRTNASSLNPQMFAIKAFFFCATVAPCCFFLLINSFILQILCSKSTFSQCPRYILLFNLVLGDMLLMAQGQALYLLGFFQIRISYPLCGCFVMITALACLISPYTFIFTSLERCVSVCFPFKHATVVTLRNTFVCVCVIWTLGCADVLTRVLLLLDFPFADLPALLMPKFCDTGALFLGPRSTVHGLVLLSVCALRRRHLRFLRGGDGGRSLRLLGQRDRGQSEEDSGRFPIARILGL